MALATIVSLASVFGLGICLALLGSIKISLTRNLEINDAQMGKLFSVFNFSNLIFVLLAGVLVDALSFKVAAIAGFILGAIAVFLFGQAKNYGAAVVACLLLGVGGMLVNTVGNTLFANPKILFEDVGRSGNLGNVFFGVGAFVTPLITAWLFRKTSYATALNVMAVILGVPAIIAIIANFPVQPTGYSLGAVAQLLPQSQIILGGLALMCYIALEVSMGGWISTYATSLGADEGKASKVLTSYWLALMIGRLATAYLIADSLIKLDVDGAWFIFGLAIAASIIAFLMSTANSLGAGSTLCFLIGIAFAPIFPTVVGLTLSRTEPALRGSVFGVIFAIGLIGAIFVPAWMGAISAGKDIKASMKVAGGTAVVLVVIALIMGFALGPPLSAAA